VPGPFYAHASANLKTAETKTSGREIFRRPGALGVSPETIQKERKQTKNYQEKR